MDAAPAIHDLRIFDLRERPDLLEAVAEAVWAAFWRHKGMPLAEIAAGFRRHLETGILPFTLAAEAGGTFAGTVSLIACDEPERADLAPWLAALWVAPVRRRQGLGATLVRAVEGRAAEAGIARLYLSARPEIASFYEARGWQAIDRDIGPARLAIMERIL